MNDPQPEGHMASYIGRAHSTGALSWHSAIAARPDCRPHHHDTSQHVGVLPLVREGKLRALMAMAPVLAQTEARKHLTGESQYALSKRHDSSRQLIRVWVQKYEAGALDEDAQAADLLQEYEAKIAALERMVGRQALEIEFLKGALKNAPRPRSVNSSVIAGPAASPSQKDAG